MSEEFSSNTENKGESSSNVDVLVIIIRAMCQTFLSHSRALGVSSRKSMSWYWNAHLTPRPASENMMLTEDYYDDDYHDDTST
jgi:hypothetical protein